MEAQLAAAKRLIAALGPEQERWKAAREQTKEKRDLLVGDCLLTAAFLSYTARACGAFPRCLSWYGIPPSPALAHHMP